MKKIIKDIKPKATKNDISVHRKNDKKPLRFHKNILDLSKTFRQLDLTKKITKRGKFADINFKEESNKTSATFFSSQIPVALFSRRLREIFCLIGAGLCVVFILNIINLFYQASNKKDLVFSAAVTGFNELNTIKQKTGNLNLTELSVSLKNAKENFKKAQQEMWLINEERGMFLNGKGLLESGQNLILAGKYLANTGELFLNKISEAEMILSEMMEKFNQEKVIGASLTAKLNNSFIGLNDVLKELRKTDNFLKEVDIKILPEDLRTKFKNAQSKISELNDYLITLMKFTPAILNLLGDKYPQTYLILLANNNERRPIMGFLGSGILMNINDGFITKSDFFDVYDFDGQMTEKISPPEALNGLTANWGLRDSNYSPHFPVSARNAAYLLEKGGGPGVDQVVVLDLYLVKKILAEIGPISVEGLTLPLTGDNFDTILSLMVESKVEGDNSPKKILDRFIQAFMEKIKKTKAAFQMAKIFKEAAEEKHFEVYSKDEEIEKFLKFLGISGEMENTERNEDYLSVIDTSIGGNKSDKYVEQKIYHQTFLEYDGTLHDQVTIERTHHFNRQEEDKLVELAAKLGVPMNDYLKEILGRGWNISSLRIYVPKGSKLKEIMGTNFNEVEEKIDEETNKTYFETTMQVAPGEKKSITIIYELPFKLDFNTKDGLDDYLLTVEKQSGTVGDLFRKELILGGALKSYKSFPNTYLEDRKVIYDGDLAVDKKFGAVVGD